MGLTDKFYYVDNSWVNLMDMDYQDKINCEEKNHFSSEQPKTVIKI